MQLNTRKDCAKCRLDKCVRVGMKNSLVAVNEFADSSNSCVDQEISNDNQSTNGDDLVSLDNKDLMNETDQKAKSASMSRSTPSSPVTTRKVEIKADVASPLPPDLIYRSTSGQELNKTSFHTTLDYKSKKHLALLRNRRDEKDNFTNFNDLPNRPSLIAKKTQSRSNKFSINVTNPVNGSSKLVTMNNVHLTEQEKLEELVIAASKLEKKEEEFNSNEEPLVFSLCNVIYLATTRLVAAINSLKSFKYLPHPDQLVLLKGSISEMIFLWSVRAFDTDSKCWTLNCLKSSIAFHGDLRLPMEVLKAAKHDDLSLYNEYDKFVGNFDPSLGKDYLLINILIAMCLFNPHRDGLIEKEHVRCERNLYRSLLKKYLDSIADDESASANHVSKLTTKIEDLTSLKEIYESSEVDPDDINQLVRTTKLLDIQNTMHHE